MTTSEIIKHLPYSYPFLFVDEIEEVSPQNIIGFYRFKEKEPFYEGHFKDNPITPGVILTECMAQIGLVCLGIYLIRDGLTQNLKPQIALTSHKVDFYIPVLPGEKVKVVSDKEVFRFNKLRCNVKMFNEKENLVARGIISGMIKR